MSDLELLERPTDKLARTEKMAADKTARSRRHQLKPIRKLHAAHQQEEAKQRIITRELQRKAQKRKAGKLAL